MWLVRGADLITTWNETCESGDSFSEKNLSKSNQNEEQIIFWSGINFSPNWLIHSSSVFIYAETLAGTIRQPCKEPEEPCGTPRNPLWCPLARNGCRGVFLTKHSSTSFSNDFSHWKANHQIIYCKAIHLQFPNVPFDRPTDHL